MNATSQSSLSPSHVWDDTLAMLRANAGLLAAIAGVFLFLPGVLSAHFIAPPESAQTPDEMFELMMAWYQANAHWFLLSALVNMIGLIAIYLLLLRSPRLTVGAAVAAALPILPFYLVMSIIYSLAFFAGLALLVIPAIYVIGRLSLASPALVAEMPRAPLSSLQRAWELSRGRGWQIALLVVLVTIAALLINAAARWSIGSVILLALGPEGVGGLLIAIIGSAIAAAGQVVVTVLIAAIYRALTARPDLAKRFS